MLRAQVVAGFDRRGATAMADGERRTGFAFADIARAASGAREMVDCGKSGRARPRRDATRRIRSWTRVCHQLSQMTAAAR